MIWPFKSKPQEPDKPKYKSDDEVWELAALDPSKAFEQILTQNASGGLRRHVALTVRTIQEIEALKANASKPTSPERDRPKANPPKVSKRRVNQRDRR